MKVLSLIKPYDKPVQTVGALWVGTYLSNELCNHPDVEEVGVVTELPDYSLFDSRIKIHIMKDLDYNSVNKSMLKKAVNIYKEYGYDVLHIHVNTLSSLKWFTAMIPETVNVVYTLHNPSMLGRSKLIYGEPYAKYLNDLPNYRIVAVSDYNAAVWKEFCGVPHDQVNNVTFKNLSTIYNAIVEYPDIPIVPISEREKKIVVCSRITSVKNVWNVLDCLRDYEIPSVFIGNAYNINIDPNHMDSAEDDYVKHCIEVLETTPNIEWKRDLNNKEVLKIMSKSYATLHMPVTEGFALVPLESMYVGTPVIYASNCEPLVEQMGKIDDLSKVGSMVEHRPGSRWTTRNRATNEAIKEMFENPRDPEIVRKYYFDNYSMKIMVQKYVDVYKSFN